MDPSYKLQIYFTRAAKSCPSQTSSLTSLQNKLLLLVFRKEKTSGQLAGIMGKGRKSGPASVKPYT
jgi:hypothetical protein